MIYSWFRSLDAPFQKYASGTYMHRSTAATPALVLDVSVGCSMVGATEILTQTRYPYPRVLHRTALNESARV